MTHGALVAGWHLRRIEGQCAQQVLLACGVHVGHSIALNVEQLGWEKVFSTQAPLMA